MLCCANVLVEITLCPVSKMAESIQSSIMDTFTTFCRKTAEDLIKLSDSVSKNAENIHDLIEKVGLLMRGVSHLSDNIVRNENGIARLFEDGKQASNVPASENSNESLAPEDDNDSLVSELCISDHEVVELKKIVADKKRERDGYFRRTIHVRKLIKQDNGRQSVSLFDRCVESLKEYNLEFLLNECSKFYVSYDGHVSFTYHSRREAIRWLIQAKEIVKQSHDTIQFWLMVPADKVGLKRKMQNYGRLLKSRRLCQSYQAEERWELGNWNLQLRVILPGCGQYIFKNSEIGDDFEGIVEKTRKLIDSLRPKVC